MGTRNLLKLLLKHQEYCIQEYQPHKMPETSFQDALKFQREMSNSLTHFAMWIATVHLPEDDKRRKRITESKKNATTTR